MTGPRPWSGWKVVAASGGAGAPSGSATPRDGASAAAGRHASSTRRCGRSAARQCPIRTCPATPKALCARLAAPGPAQLGDKAGVVHEGVILGLGDEARRREEPQRLREPRRRLACTRARLARGLIVLAATEGPVAAVDHCKARVVGVPWVGGDVPPRNRAAGMRHRRHVPASIGLIELNGGWPVAGPDDHAARNPDCSGRASHSLPFSEPGLSTNAHASTASL